MKKIFSGSFALGGIVVLIGILLLIKNIFNIHIPVFTLVFSFGLIYLGILLIRGNLGKGRFGHSGPGNVMFDEQTIRFNPGQSSYSVLFGSGTLNLQGIKPEAPLHIHVDCTFGEMQVVVPRDIPLQVLGSSTFAQLNGPDLRKISFGDYNYISAGFNPSLPGITLHARVLFGEMRVFYI